MSEEQRLFIPGPAGQLEAIHTTPEEGQADRIAIICHPHPLHEGTMNNKVVTLLAKTFNKLGFETLRFNYRGVGKSEGHYGDRVGEIEDLKAVKAWAEPKSQFCLSGFSFGAFIAASVANESENVSQLITVAPAIHRYSCKMAANRSRRRRNRAFY
jgi:uncharacterized protein